MATNIYISQEGDVVDMIAQLYYGSTLGPTEHIYANNPGLEAYNDVLPAGVRILLTPYNPIPTADRFVTPW